MALVKIKSGGVWGIEGFEVDVEIDISPGLPSFNIVGLPDTAIKESKDRVKSAIKNLGYPFPQKRITVNLSPSGVKKQGTLYDLPIAVGILTISGLIPQEKITEFVFLGELSLDGSLNKVSGVLPIVISLKNSGYRKFILPASNGAEGAIVKGTETYAFGTLEDIVLFLQGEKEINPLKITPPSEDLNFQCDLGEIIGQTLPKKALEICAAGGHNLSMIGSPGSGKSMLAKRIITILPPLEFDEALEVSRIYSVAGLLEEGFVKSRPFRSPHHTASEVAIIGGGSNPLPGEVSLAHRGVLFLDELPEFSRRTIEVLRQPMEDGYINISRAQGRVRFPARFTLITAQNPCPCGNFGNPFKNCTCTPIQIRNYNTKISGPIKDRIDLTVWVDPIEKEHLLGNFKGEDSKTVRERVLTAYRIQRERFKNSVTDFNGRMTNAQVESYCINMMNQEAKKLLKSAVDKFNLSGRAYFRLLKVARTIADLEQSEFLRAEHIAQALQFRIQEIPP